MQPSELLPGDLIQARLQGTTTTGQPEQWLVTVFPVASTTGTTVAGSVFYPDGIDTSTGWVIDLIERPAPTLPTTLAEITATLQDGTTVTAMGKSDLWTNTVTGQPVPAAQIVAFTLNQ